MAKTQHHEVVFCIVNEGFSEAVMDAARDAGATGGTVLHASGTASVDAEKRFGITIQPRKEIVMILIDVKIKEAVLKNLYEAVGLQTAGQGIAFTMPVAEVVGLTAVARKREEEPAKAEDAAKVEEDKSKEKQAQSEAKKEQENKDK